MCTLSMVFYYSRSRDTGKVITFISRALNQSCAAIQSASGEPGALQHILGVSWPPTRKDIPEPSHGRVLREKFRSVYVVKGVWSLLKDLFFFRDQSCVYSQPKSACTVLKQCKVSNYISSPTINLFSEWISHNIKPEWEFGYCCLWEASIAITAEPSRL